jgi:ubiquinone/menaquinone biosynthesis C-methylase UbiE
MSKSVRGSSDASRDQSGVPVHAADSVVRSNIEVHTRMADSYDRDEPHFRPENKTKVKANLLRIAEQTGTGRLLDIGCGTGFVISLLADTFDEIHGVDPTTAMLEKVDIGRGNVTLHEGVAEALPFPDATFDLVTAYSVLHHLADHRPALAEAARVLRPGGVLYVDLEPNRAFWRSVESVEEHYANRLEALDEIVAREVQAVLHIESDVHSRFAIDPEVFREAEYIKANLGGFEPLEFEADALGAGFASCTSTYEWFVGQGALIHGPSPADATAVERHLRRALPMSANLFKYLRFEATR